MIRCKNILMIVGLCAMVQVMISHENDLLSYSFSKKYGQVEVGGPFVGIEFHQSRPLPSRISFFYPVANSIDLSTDYWKRDESLPMAIGFALNNGQKYWIGREGWNYIISPHMITFLNEDSIFTYRIRYEFCLNQPAMVVSITIKNKIKQSLHVRAYTHLLLALRTCQTYARKDSAMMTKESGSNTVVAQFTDTETKSASVFVINTGEKPIRSWCDANDLLMTDNGKSVWGDSSFAGMSFVDTATKHTRAAAAFEYEKQLSPNDEMTLILVVGSTTTGELKEQLATLSKMWRDEIQAYDDYVRNYAVSKTQFATGDMQLDRTIQWSKGILAANAHYLNGIIVPMPCPAEYNFFFTHDLLMTNLGAVLYDIKRVKKDLMYVASLARDSIIPHAYYWKDDGFKTEFCTPSNWNHLWFIEISARYFRHSLDTATLRLLYPLIVKSLAEIKKQLRDDNLMYAHRPDWWDIGWNEGPRAYMTTLAIRQIENYLYIASVVDTKNRTLKDLEQTAARMRSAIAEKLWNDSLKFLLNYNGNDLDRHQYMGSLVAPALNMLDEKRSSELIETARRKLLAPKVGIRAAIPADFHTDSMISYFKFLGKEAGEAYTYINGGVWFHNNAWYALALHSIGRSDEAKEFVKQTMTIDGIVNSPNGVPALYEYRYSNESSPRFGEIDKPSFLWAGGFYLYTLYTLVGMNENVWNLSFSEYTATFQLPIDISYTFSDVKTVHISGTGRSVHSITYDGMTVPSLVIPIEQHTAKDISVVKGNTGSPYLKSLNAMLHSVNMKGKKFTAVISSFKNHSTVIELVSLQKPKRAKVNAKNHVEMTSTKKEDGVWISKISFTAGEGYDKLTVEW